MPRGYAIVPSGIWKIVKARAKAPMAPAASVEPSIVRRSRVSWLPAEADRPRPEQDQRPARLAIAQVDRGRVVEADAGRAGAPGRGRGDGAGHGAHARPAEAEPRDRGSRRRDDHEVVDDRRHDRRREAARRVQDARRHAPQGEEDRAEEEDPRQLDGLARSAVVEPRGDERPRSGAAMNVTSARAASTTSSRFAIVETTRHARSCSPAATSAAIVGMTAEAGRPPPRAGR